MTTQQNTTAASGGTSIAGLLGIAFIVLKLTGVIDWSWWLVTLPLWGGLAVVLAILAIGGLVVITVAALDHRRAAKRRTARTR